MRRAAPRLTTPALFVVDFLPLPALKCAFFRWHMSRAHVCISLHTRTMGPKLIQNFEQARELRHRGSGVLVQFLEGYWRVLELVLKFAFHIAIELSHIA